ncbi:MAG: hypothetical protein C4315_12385 [Chloroflexota bacterium]
MEPGPQAGRQAEVSGFARWGNFPAGNMPWASAWPALGSGQGRSDASSGIRMSASLPGMVLGQGAQKVDRPDPGPFLNRPPGSPV